MDCSQNLTEESKETEECGRTDTVAMDTPDDTDRWSADSLIRFSQLLHKCKLCTTESVMFTSKESFIQHVQGFHLSEDREFKCKGCRLRFRCGEDFMRHVEDEHPESVLDNLSSSTHVLSNGIGASLKLERQVIPHKESDSELHVMYDKHASTIIIDTRQYYYCSLCGFKFSSHTECQGHFTGSYHSQKIHKNKVENSSETNAKDDNSEPKPRSRRKRTLPMPCRRQVEENGSDTESVLENAENTQTEDDLISWSASNPLRFSLMQSDRKRLALSSPREVDRSDKTAAKNLTQLYSGKDHYIPNGVNSVLNFCQPEIEPMVLEPNATENLLHGSSLVIACDIPEDLSKKPRASFMTSLNEVTSSKPDVTPARYDVMSAEPDVTSSKLEVTSTKSESITHKCHRCDAEFGVLEDLCTHYKETHMGAQHSAMGDQYFKVIWLKHLLPQFVIAHESGCVSRDELLVRMAIVADENALWGPACNKAVRETFPDSNAMRKGKFKKYYFGITYVDSSAPSASPGLETSDEDGTINDEDEETKSDPGGHPGHQEVEKLMQLLPDVVQYTGSVDSSVARETILGMLGGKLGDSGVLSWAGQCNKAVRQVFPHVSLRRKGKYKTTFYFGLELIKEKKKISGSAESSHKPCTWMTSPSATGSGPPVVNVRDLEECKGPSHLSRLTSSIGRPMTADLSFLNDIIKGDSTNNTVNYMEKEIRSTNSPKSPLVATLNVPLEVNAANARGQQPSPPTGNNSNHLENLEKLILLHPGPFVTARIFSRRFQRLAPNTDKVLAAMTMLQGRGLGQVFTLKQGNSKVFFKAVPSKSLEVALSVLGVRFIDYQVMFSERDSKLEDSLHDRLRAFYPQPDVLISFYSH